MSTGLRAAGQRATGLIALALLALPGCTQQPATPPAGSVAKPDADEFIALVNAQLKPVLREVAAADWTQATDITIDTQLLSARANDRYLDDEIVKTPRLKPWQHRHLCARLDLKNSDRICL